MNKFEHFSEEDSKLRKVECLGNITYVFQDDGNEIKFHVSSRDAYRLVTAILNAALDAHLIQRVVQKESSKKSKYRLKKMPDGKVWMLENLREKVEGAVWCEKYHCYLYTWEQAQKAVPKGFHLPTREEFAKLAGSLGYGKEPNFYEKFCREMHVQHTGYVGSDGKLYHQGVLSHWWSSTQSSTTYAYSLGTGKANSRVGPARSRNKFGGFGVRCIKD